MRIKKPRPNVTQDQDINDRLTGWIEIAEFIGVSPQTAMKYRSSGLKVYKPGGGANCRVMASRAEVSAWMKRHSLEQPQQFAPLPPQPSTESAPSDLTTSVDHPEAYKAPISEQADLARPPKRIQQ